MCGISLGIHFDRAVVIVFDVAESPVVRRAFGFEYLVRLTNVLGIKAGPTEFDRFKVPIGSTGKVETNLDGALSVFAGADLVPILVSGAFQGQDIGLANIADVAATGTKSIVVVI